MSNANFNQFAVAIVKAAKSLDVAASKACDAIRSAMQGAVDLAAITYARDEKGTKAFQKDLKECEAFMDAVAVGMLEAKTVTEYVQGAARAHFHAVPWAPTLKNDADKKLPWGKKSAGVETPSKATTSNPLEDAHVAMRAALAAYRAANAIDLAGDLLDRVLETFPEFKE